MIGTRLEKVHTIVQRRIFEAPANVAEVWKILALVRQDRNDLLGLSLTESLPDDAVWFEVGPGDNEISICFQADHVEEMVQR